MNVDAKATGEIPTCVTPATTPGQKRRGNGSDQIGTTWQGHREGADPFPAENETPQAYSR